MRSERREVIMSSINFHVLAKPIGPICNLDCKYCFYLEKESLYPQVSKWAMREEVLDSYIRQYIEAHDTPVVNFAWQGGEPTLLGVEYFRKLVEIQKKYANGKHIQNAFQTNGVLLNDEWAALFKENEFLIGLSIDGPRESARRLSRGQGRPAHLRQRHARHGDAEAQWRGVQHADNRAPRQRRSSARGLSVSERERQRLHAVHPHRGADCAPSHRRRSATDIAGFRRRGAGSPVVGRAAPVRSISMRHLRRVGAQRCGPHVMSNSST